MNNEKDEEEMMGERKKKPHHIPKMPSNLEAVYIDGHFAGRKVRDPPISEIAKTAQDYIKLIQDKTQKYQLRCRALIDYILRDIGKIDLFYKIPKKRIYEIIDNISNHDLHLLYINLKKFTDKKMTRFLKYCESKMKNNPENKPWYLDK